MVKLTGIYKIVNIINNKLYIGQSVDIYKRWNYHKYELNNNKHFNIHLQNSWNKYGEDNFKFEIIEICPKDRLNDKEKYYIMFYNSNNENGYNISEGGNDSIITDETKRKMSQSHIGILRTIESRAKQSLKLSGKNNPMYGMRGEKHPSFGKKRSNNTCSKIRDSYTEQRRQEYRERILGENNPMYGHSEDNPSARKIMCIETGEIFLTEKDAAKWCGLKSHTNISMVCYGKRKHAGKDPNTGKLLSWKFC